MNYLGLNGILGLTGDADGPPVQAAGQIADIGGGSLMAAVGIMVALRERDRSGEGQLVDCSMFDGALSWLAMVAARGVRHRPRAAPRGAPAGRALRLLPPLCRAPTGTSRSARWSRSSGRRGVRAWAAPTSSRTSSTRPASETHAAGVGDVRRAHARGVASASPSEHDCCLEPVLELDEVLDSELVRAREMVVGDRPARRGRRRCASSGCRSSSAAPRPTPGRAPAPSSASTPTRSSPTAGYAPDEIAALHESGAVAGTCRRRPPAPS